MLKRFLVILLVILTILLLAFLLYAVIVFFREAENGCFRIDHIVGTLRVNGKLLPTHLCVGTRGFNPVWYDK